MKAIRFVAKVSEKGVIRIPFASKFFNQEVEVIILPRPSVGGKNAKASDFLKKWAGFLIDSDTDQSKYDYLSEKYK